MSQSLLLHNQSYTITSFGDEWYRIYAAKKLSAETALDLTTIGNIIQEEKIKTIQNIISTKDEIAIQTKDILSVITQIKQLDFDHVHQQTKTYELPIYFSDHTDWERILAHTNLSKEAYLKLLLQQNYTIDMLGFLVGFFYCKKLDNRLQVPRKNKPATRVEAGSVAIAADYIGIYSLPSPGGWNVIGKTPLQLVNLDKNPPTKLKVSDKIVFKAIDLDTFGKLEKLNLDVEQYNARY